MSIDRVTPEHLYHLIEQARLPQGAADDLKSRVAVAGSRADVCAALERVFPGLTERLERDYAFYGRTSAHLWRCPCLIGLDGGAALREINAHLGQQLPVQQWAVLPSVLAPDQNGERVARFKVDGDDLRLTVYINRMAETWHEGQPIVRPKTIEVEVQVDLATGKDQLGNYVTAPVAEVYYGTTYATLALRTALLDLFGHVVPDRRGAEQGAYVRPVLFTEAHVAALAAQLGMAQVVLDGPDPTGALGAIALRGHRQGRFRQPVNANDARVRDQDAAPNDVRELGFTRVHPGDGYREQGEVSFSFRARHPHLSFTHRVSRSTMKWVIDNLCAIVPP